MIKIFLLLLLVSLVISALIRPWVGVVSYYAFTLLGPQYIWWWNFEGLRVAFWIALATIVGVIVQLVSGISNYHILKSKTNFWILVLWVSITVSYYFGPYVSAFDSNMLSPVKIYSLMNNIFFIYFIAHFSFKNLNTAKYMFYVYLLIVIYLTYWANVQYLTGNWNQFNYGRLMGPRSATWDGIYGDENAFAMVFVTGIPFIYFAAEMSRRVVSKIVLYLIGLLAVHAIFLTGSRGGLLGVAVAMLVLFSINKKWLIGILTITVLITFFQWQGGEVMKTRSDTIIDYEGDSSSESRIDAWKGGMHMLYTHPITGVGLGSFITALPLFYPTNPRVAHNTFVQYAGESGLFAAIAYIMIVLNFLKNSRTIYYIVEINESSERWKNIKTLNTAVTVSFSGLLTCSMFLSLNVFEIFFYLLLINNYLLYLCENDK